MECIRPYMPEAISPFGDVQDSEILSRVVSSPEHIKKKTKGANEEEAPLEIKASAIPNSHLKKTGLSLVRMGLLPKADFEAIARAISGSIKGGGNVPAGVLQATAEALRSFQDANGNLALCVFDDATNEKDEMPKNDAHAITIQRREYSDAEILAIKTELMEKIFLELIPMDQIQHPD